MPRSLREALVAQEVRMALDSGMTITEARDVLGQLVGRVQYGHERIVLTRHGKPAAAIVPMDDYEALERLEDEIDLADALAALREPGRVSWAELKAELKL